MEAINFDNKIAPRPKVLRKNDNFDRVVRANKINMYRNKKYLKRQILFRVYSMLLQ